MDEFLDNDKIIKPYNDLVLKFNNKPLGHNSNFYKLLKLINLQKINLILYLNILMILKMIILKNIYLVIKLMISSLEKINLKLL